MKFYTDDYFHIGQMHLASGKPCQDYSFSGLQGDSAYATVSDGCSTGRHTDVGARIVALSTVNTLRQYLKSKNVPLSRVRQQVTKQHDIAISKSMEAFDLELQDMLATCLYACFTPEEGLISIQGDGAVAKVYKDGSIKLVSYQWENNTPIYPVYAVDDYKSFISAHRGNPNSKSLKLESRTYNSLGDMEINQSSLSTDEAVGGVIEELFAEEIANLSFITLFTDGVMQVDGINWEDAAMQLLAFKNLNGEFAKRRMIRFIKDSKSNGRKGPLDDISFAVIRIAGEEE